MQHGFSVWKQQFRRSFSEQTGLRDLDHCILRQLADPGEASTRLFNALIIGFLGLGDLSFDVLDHRLQSRIIDVQLFLSDQVHFEMMARLGWLEAYGGREDALFEMVLRFDEARQDYRDQPPRLSPDFPGFSEYAALIDRDRQVFIRRLIPSALKAFSQEFGRE
ncbi:MAG: hypothetical protein P8X55_07970 [Desulfosarcinaceae bacterium]